MIVNGKEYPFDAPTHKMVGAIRIELTEEEIETIVQEWAAEYDLYEQSQQQEESIDFAKRQTNIQMMNGYMANLVTTSQLTQNNFDLFLSDTAALVQQYLGGGGRLITWIETVSRNGYNATTTGFKTKTAYRGALNNGVYPRAEVILAILNNL